MNTKVEHLHRAIGDFSEWVGIGYFEDIEPNLDKATLDANPSFYTATKCVCGTNIKNNYIIARKSTLDDMVVDCRVIGSDCIRLFKPEALHKTCLGCGRAFRWKDHKICQMCEEGDGRCAYCLRKCPSSLCHVCILMKRQICPLCYGVHHLICKNCWLNEKCQRCNSRLTHYINVEKDNARRVACEACLREHVSPSDKPGPVVKITVVPVGETNARRSMGSWMIMAVGDRVSCEVCHKLFERTTADHWKKKCFDCWRAGRH